MAAFGALDNVARHFYILANDFIVFDDELPTVGKFLSLSLDDAIEFKVRIFSDRAFDDVLHAFFGIVAAIPDPTVNWPATPI